MSRWRFFQVSGQGQGGWNSIVRVTLVTLGSPGLRAGKSPAFLVVRGLARQGWSRVHGVLDDADGDRGPVFLPGWLQLRQVRAVR
jgi:hypothetical protein